MNKGEDGGGYKDAQKGDFEEADGAFFHKGIEKVTLNAKQLAALHGGEIEGVVSWVVELGISGRIDGYGARVIGVWQDGVL